MTIIRNQEKLDGFDVHWPWLDGPLKTGVTAVIRAKDEARNLPWVLPRLLETVDRVVLVDNLSTDDTAETAQALADQAGAGHRLEVMTYPFPVSRCGPEHLETPPNSVHSLAHFYNWSFSHVHTRYSMKWDGDMVLTREGAALLRSLAWQIEYNDTIVIVPRYALYVASDSVAYLDVRSAYIEPWIYPMGPQYVFVKGFDWEVRNFPEDVRRLTVPKGTCVELKWLDTDEFSHWTSVDAFDPDRSPRKVREHHVFTALAEGRPDELDAVHRVEAPEGIHVVDHVVDHWLPTTGREFTA